MVFDGAIEQFAADDLAKSGIFHGIGAEESNIKCSWSVIDVNEPMGVDIPCFIHFQTLSL